jgi:hypothetical protein
MQKAPKPHCAQSDVPNARIVTLFTREPYCGRACLSEGQLKYVRMVLRAKAEMFEYG